MAFTYTAFAYILALIFDAFLIFFAIFHVISFDELKTDFKSPIEHCYSLNPWVPAFFDMTVSMMTTYMDLLEALLSTYMDPYRITLVLPEFALHSSFILLFLSCQEWFSLLINIPLFAYNINRFLNRSVLGLYDPTTIMNFDVLTKCQREGWIKLGFYLLSFFYYLYGMIYALIST